MQIRNSSQIFKNVNQRDLTTYSISILTTSSTIFEEKSNCYSLKFIYGRFYLLPSKQYGFRITINKSTIHPIHNVMTNSKNSMDGNNHTLAIVLDIKKVCDVVCHQKLICKLEKYGIWGNTLECFKIYLNK